MGRVSSTERFHLDLLTWAEHHFDVDDVVYRWSAQDYVPVDSLPFVGPILPLTPDVVVATGFAKWGMTNGTAAALALAERLTAASRTTASWSFAFDPARVGGLSGLQRIVDMNLRVTRRFLEDHARPPLPAPPTGQARPGSQGAPDRPPPVDASIRREGVHYIGTSGQTTEGEAPCRVSVTCPHLGGILRWNDAERTWDCPLHGSRFARCGALLQGPAVDDLQARP